VSIFEAFFEAFFFFFVVVVVVAFSTPYTSRPTALRLRSF
jgi:hypothetical protein